jgi:hypothetical protein
VWLVEMDEDCLALSMIRNHGDQHAMNQYPELATRGLAKVLEMELQE